ncbi:acyl-CoA dehydrogenase family protein [Streptomyces sp. NPDC101118]|uniref:acyl-CoA dehydrogenase family protein n=1 Tax=Streptomyces sp. NPDC101118 TaxID=3366109 RepID=UPI003808AEFB
MDAAFTAEQDEIRRTLRELLGKRSGPDEVKAAVRTPAGYDRELWQQLARQLGLPGLALPEDRGGVGCTLADLALACEETGRALTPSPLLATSVLAAPLVAALGTPAQQAELLPRIAGGELTATLVVPGAALSTALALTCDNAPGGWAGGGRAGGIQARVDMEAGGWLLYGEAAQVLDGHSAELLVVAAHTGGFARSRAQLFLVRADAPGLVRSRQTVLDETRPQGRVQLRDTPAELLGADDQTEICAALAAAGLGAAAVLAAEAAGAAAQALARTVEYVQAREQFGRPVGSFQAVKHRLADVYVQLQAARSAAYYAAWDPGQGGLALAQALEALRTAAAEAVQLHGGIGFTWEHDAHLYFKRAAADELLFGPVHRLRAYAAQRAGLFAPAGSASGAAPGAVPGTAPGTPAGTAPGTAPGTPATTEERVAV